MQTNVYIDGFNLYYCAVKDTPYKWLDLLALCQNIFPNKTFHRIRYFTAKVKGSKHDPDAPTRQDIYWRALATIPQIHIIEGKFVQWPKLMPQYPLAYINNNYNKKPNTVQVLKAEEKGSDVNLAAFLIYDNCVNDAGESIVISNDSDISEAIRIVTREMGKAVIVVNPNRTKMARRHLRCKQNKDLIQVATVCVWSINEKHLANSQFTPTLIDSVGQFSKPTSW